MTQEDIAKELAKMDDWNYDSLKEKATCITDGNTQSTYLRRADQILQLLPKHKKEVIKLLYPDKKLAVLSDDQSTPLYTNDFLSDFDAKRAQSNFTDVLYDFGRRVTKDILNANFKRIEEDL